MLTPTILYYIKLLACTLFFPKFYTNKKLRHTPIPPKSHTHKTIYIRSLLKLACNHSHTHRHNIHKHSYIFPPTYLPTNKHVDMGIHTIIHEYSHTMHTYVYISIHTWLQTHSFIHTRLYMHTCKYK